MLIVSASKVQQENFLNEYGADVYLQYDEDKIKEAQKEGMPFIEEISDEVKLKISSSKHLKETHISVMYPANALDLKTSETELPKNDSGMTGIGGYHYPDVTVFGYNHIETQEAFVKGNRKVTQGAMPKGIGEALISEVFAELNNLTIGSEITVYDSDVSATFKPLVLKVSGIYYDATVFQGGEQITQPEFDIITSYDTMASHQTQAGKRLYVVNAQYVLKYPGLIEAFNQDAHDLGLNEFYKMATDEMSYNQIVAPANQLAITTKTIMTIVLAVGCVILLLVSFMTIHERQYEIGVLRSMGMSKMNVIKGLLIESLTMVLIALMIGLSVGMALAPSVSKSMIKEQQHSNLHIVEVQDINVELSLDAIINVSVIAIGMSLISSSLGVIRIVRDEPMAILSKRGV